MQILPEGRFPCKHCGRMAEGYAHVEGAQAGLQRCDPDDTGEPYGLNAGPDGQPCKYPCAAAATFWEGRQ